MNVAGIVVEMGTFATRRRHVGSKTLSSENVSFLPANIRGQNKAELSDLQVLGFCSHVTAAANPVA